METPQEQAPHLAQALGTHSLYLKREDVHPYGSHKGRSIPHLIDHYLRAGFHKFAISSSGNGALAAALHVEKLNNKKGADSDRNTVNPTPVILHIFIGKNIHLEKLKILKEIASRNEGTVFLHQSERPLQKLITTVQSDTEIKSLRQSTDDVALVGYESLASELLQVPHLQAVFVPSSSGTTAEALNDYFHKSGKPVQIHIVQTEQIHPIVDALMQAKREKGAAVTLSGESSVRSLAHAIVDKVGHRKNSLVKKILISNGGGWIVGNEDIAEAQKVVHETEALRISPNSALSIAGLKKAIQSGQQFSGAVVCLITGN